MVGPYVREHFHVHPHLALHYQTLLILFRYPQLAFQIPLRGFESQDVANHGQYVSSTSSAYTQHTFVPFSQRLIESILSDECGVMCVT